MNVTEGFRRLGLAFGVVGFLAGLTLSVLGAFPVIEQFEEYFRLNKLKNDFKIRSSIFSVDEARSAGLSDDLMFNYLATHEKWNSDAIFHSGYSKADVLSVVRQSPRTPKVSAIDFVTIVMCPLAGFLIPWGTFRSVGWAIDGSVNRIAEEAPEIAQYNVLYMRDASGPAHCTSAREDQNSGRGSTDVRNASK
jgi:hypothetical protein